MEYTPQIKAILKEVETWPAHEAETLARAIAGRFGGPSTRQMLKLEDLVGIGRGDRPAPTDDEVKRWIDEHRVEKYG